MDYKPMESSETLRNKCGACHRQFVRKDHLVDHMRTSFHSVHEPMCGVCHKHCRSFDSLREHLIGPLPKVECARLFTTRGCKFCLSIFDTPNALRIHHGQCLMSRPNGLFFRASSVGTYDEMSRVGRYTKVVALACKMVGGGSDGCLDLCARVCLTDEYDKIIFHTYVKPHIPVTNYRYETTGIRAEHLKDGMPLKQVQRKIEEFLCNGEPLWKIRSRSAKSRILVGHGLDHDLDCLAIEYPTIMMRDTSKYPPLMKTSKLSNSLKYLTQSYLGYEIQTGFQDPYEDCVSTMRLYMRMRSQNHKPENYPLSTNLQNRNIFAHSREAELEKMNHEELFAISRDTSKYPPLMKTSKLSNSLKYLTQSYLGYEIQTGFQDPYEDCVSTMRLYMRMRFQNHKPENYPLSTDLQNRNIFAYSREAELEKMNHDELFAISRDTSKYPPLMKTSKLSNSLKYLTQSYLGYEIQTGFQDPYEDCVSTIRLYMRMRSQNHKPKNYPLSTDLQNRNIFAHSREAKLEKMNHEELFAISRSDYYCWCLDLKGYT